MALHCRKGIKLASWHKGCSHRKDCLRANPVFRYLYPTYLGVMKKFFAIVFLMSFAFAKAQSVNDYKYVIVDNQYEFQSSANQYRLNELMEFELQKYGFETYRNNEVLPLDLNRGLCNALQLKVYKSGRLWTDMYATLVNCNGEVLFQTIEVRSQQKDYQKDYFSAVRESFVSFGDLNYQYNGGQKSQPSTVTVFEDVQEVMPASQNIEVAVAAPRKVEEVQPTVQEKIEETVQVETQEEIKNKEQPRAFDFEDIANTEYSLKFDESKDNFKLYQYGAEIGSGRKSSAGVYLVSTPGFTGIGFTENDNFIIEYDDEYGATKRIVLEK